MKCRKRTNEVNKTSISVKFFFCFVSFLFFIILLFGFMVSAVVFDHLGQSDENSVFAWIKRGGGEGLLDPTLPLNE